MFRYGLASENARMTLSDIGKKVGFSNERVRQILNSSLEKLRESLHRRFLAGNRIPGGTLPTMGDNR